MAHILLADVKRRHESKHFVGRAVHEKQSFLQGDGEDGSCESRWDGAMVEFDPDHQTHRPDFGDVVLDSVESSKEGCELMSSLLDVIENFLFAEDVNHLTSSGTSHSVACICSSHSTGRLSLRQFSARGNKAERQSVSHAFCRAENVGNNTELFIGEHRPSSTIPSLDLVEDQ